MSTVHLEPLTFVVRIFGEGKQYGDPYDWVATAVKIDDNVLEIKGALKAPTPEQFRALQKDLRAMGWKKVIYKRKTGGEDIIREKI